MRRVQAINNDHSHVAVSAVGSRLGVQSAENCQAGLQATMPAPLFVLPDADMNMFDLDATLHDRHVVLYFYARNGMPMATRQMIAFSDHEAAFQACGAEVVAVSLDDCLRHADFRDKHGLAMRLLSDEDAHTCRLYGVLQSQEIGGVARFAVQRSTFIIGRDGLIHHVFHDEGEREHLAVVLKSLQQLTRSHYGNHQKHRRYT